jgi:translocation and assembly module TamB
VGLRFARGRVEVDTAVARTAAGVVSVRQGSALGFTSRSADSVLFSFDLDSLDALPPFAQSLTAASGDSATRGNILRGRITGGGIVYGSLSDPDLRAQFAGRDVSFGGSGARNVTAVLALNNALARERSGTLTLSADSGSAFGVALATFGARYDIERGTASTFRIDGRAADGAIAAIAGRSTASAGGTSFTIDTMRVDLGTNIWRLATPGRFTVSGSGYTIESLELAGAGGSRLSASGSIPRSAEMSVRVNGERVPLADVARIARINTLANGSTRLSLALRGRPDAPEFTLNAEVDSMGVGDARIERLTAAAHYAGARLSVDAGLYHRGQRAISATAELPIDLGLGDIEDRLPEAPLSARVTSLGVNLGVLEALFPQLRDTEGRFSANVEVSGTWKRPRLVGPVSIVASRARLVGLGLQLRDVNASIDFAGDSAVFRQRSRYEGGGPTDTASVTGHVAFREYLNPSFDLTFFAQNFRIVQLPRVADLYINSQLRLNGSFQNSALSGFVNVDRGALYIPELAQKRLVALAEIDSALAANREFAAPVPSALLENLELRNVRVTVGDQVWLRSAESNASIQLGGAVSMTSVRVPRQNAAREVEMPGEGRIQADSVYRLALEGTLSADRGEYRLDMGVVQRKFQVEPGGTVTFFGEPELNPTLNISALHVVRGATGQDVGRDIRVRVRLTGSLSNYQVSFESADGLDLSQSDLISYLVTGAPTFELGAAGNQNLRTAAAILLPSLGTWLGDRWVGSRFDLFQLELAMGEHERFGDLSEVFKRTRVGVGKQIGSRTFVSANTTFCQLGGLLEGQSSSTEELIQSIGVKVETRFNHNFSMALSAEPSTAALRCAATGSSARGIISSPPQLGIDLFKVWRF